MKNERNTEPAKAIAHDLFAVIDSLAAIKELGQPIEVRTQLADQAGAFLTNIVRDSRELAKNSLTQRSERMNADPEAIKRASHEPTHVPLQESASSAVIGRVEGRRTGAAAGGLKVVARTRAGEVVAEAVTNETGAFAFDVEENIAELRIEATDESGAPMAVSTVRLEKEGKVAYFVTLTADEGKTDDSAPKPSSRFGSGELEDIRRSRLDMRRNVGRFTARLIDTNKKDETDR